MSVCLSVGHDRDAAKTDEPAEMPFGERTRVGPRNHVLDGGRDLPTEKVTSRDMHATTFG